MTALEQLGAHVATSGAPPRSAARELVELHLIDTVGAWIAEHVHAGRPGAARFSREDARAQGGHDPLALDLATRCALARLSEIDDIHLASMTTPGSIVIPGALTIAGALPGAASRRRDRRDPRRLRGDDPARPRDRRAGDPLSRHLADLFRRPVRHRRGGGAAAQARRAADRECAGAGADLRGARRRPPQCRHHVALARRRQRRPQRARRRPGGAGGLHRPTSTCSTETSWPASTT